MSQKTSSMLFVTGSAKRGVIADPNSTYLNPMYNLTCEYGNTLQVSSKIPVTYHYYFSVIIIYEVDSLKNWGDI